MMHWTVSEPLENECSACEAAAAAAGVSAAHAAELVAIGAVYVDSWPEGKEAGKPVKWRRARGIDRALLPGRFPGCLLF
jgi:hypothetical protein